MTAWCQRYFVTHKVTFWQRFVSNLVTLPRIVRNKMTMKSLRRLLESNTSMREEFSICATALLHLNSL